MSREIRGTRRFVKSAALAAILLGLAVPQALAAPVFEVNLERDSAAFPIVSHSDERVDFTARVKNVGSDPTDGTVYVEVELPGGDHTFAYETEEIGSNCEATPCWTCKTTPSSGVQHARAVCSRSNILAEGSEYPALKVITALGTDAPDLGLARATAYGGSAPAPASDQLAFPIAPIRPFGLTNFTAHLLGPAGDDYVQAGGHPFSGVGEFVLAKRRILVTRQHGNRGGNYAPVEDVKQVITDVPRGVVGSATAIPTLCPDMAQVVVATCPDGSLVGGIDIVLGDTTVHSPIFAVEPESGTPAQFAFTAGANDAYVLSARLRADDGYAVSFELAPAGQAGVQESTVTLCDFGGKANGVHFDGCKKAGEAGSNPVPLFTNPTRCGSPSPVTRTRLDSWQHPGIFVEATPFENAEIEGCDQVDFEPAMSLEPTSGQADSPTGLNVSLTMPTEGLETQGGISQANLKGVRIAFPEGMAVNASAGQGLGSCTLDQVGMSAREGRLVPDDSPVNCPDSSKIGTVEVQTPLIEAPLEGSVYIARQGEVEGSLIGLYLVFESKRDGIIVKVPGKVTPDPVTGQLIATVDQSPEAPFSAVTMSFPAGPRATLINPPECGSYQFKAELFPWSGGAPVTQTSTYKVSEGPDGSPCPNGALNPKLSAGTTNPLAGHTSPFVLNLSREDGSDRFASLNLSTPPGLSAYLRGVSYCPGATLAAISSDPGTGQAQIDDPSCPAASQVGTASAGAGAGSDPLFVDTGRAYLAGPYKGAPLSLALVAPAVAGPLDLGNVVVRTALYLNPETAQLTAVSDPIPTILHGILLDIRDIRVAIDRPGFTLNPTNCEPMAIGATVKGEDGASSSVSNRFQVSGCENLTFGPKLGVRLTGGTRRGAHPALQGTLRAAPGETNVSGASVTIPRSEFLDQSHIRTICTRVQFAAKACPPGSIYGNAVATTPLLDYPVEGPVYLRSSNHKLPDLVVDLHGPDYQPIQAVVVGRVDSIKGQIRTTFEAAPDVPITKFTLSMQGGKKGLLVNSRNICGGTYRATVKLSGHNGMSATSRPAVRNGKCGKGRRGEGGHRRAR